MKTVDPLRQARASCKHFARQHGGAWRVRVAESDNGLALFVERDNAPAIAGLTVFQAYEPLTTPAHAY